MTNSLFPASGLHSRRVHVLIVASVAPNTTIPPTLPETAVTRVFPMMRVVLSLAVLTVLLATPRIVFAQPAKPAPGDAMLEAYLKAAVAEIDKRVLDGAKTKAEWEGKRDRLKREYFEMLGLWPLPEKTPLNAKV